MQGARHAIMVAPDVQGWMWELINVAGGITATGFASSQEMAMESAWCAVRSSSNTAHDEFPEIILGRSNNRNSLATAQRWASTS
jgi:hypothetical protein